MFLSASKRQHLRFYRSFFSLFPKFHFSQKKSFLSFLPTNKRQHLHFYRLFFFTYSLFPKFHFSQKNSFLSFLPTNNNTPFTSTDCFLHFFIFPKKKSILSIRHFYPQTTISPALLQIIFCTFALFPQKNSILSILRKPWEKIYENSLAIICHRRSWKRCWRWPKPKILIVIRLAAYGSQSITTFYWTLTYFR
mgnify:CR=1 FL=1